MGMALGVSLGAQSWMCLQDSDPTDTALVVPGVLWAWLARGWCWGFTFSLLWEVKHGRGWELQGPGVPGGSEGMWAQVTGNKVSLDSRMNRWKHHEEPWDTFCVCMQGLQEGVRCPGEGPARGETGEFLFQELRVISSSHDALCRLPKTEAGQLQNKGGIH